MNYFQDSGPVCSEVDVDNFVNDLTERGYTARDLRTKPQGERLDASRWRYWTDGIFDLIWVHEDAIDLFKEGNRFIRSGFSYRPEHLHV